MPRARPGPRLDLIAQLAALVGLVVVFLLLLSILREEPATRDAPVAATTSRTTAPPAPLVSEGPILQPPPPLPPSEEELARRAKVVGEGKGGGRPLATSDGAPEKTVRPHIALTDAQGRNVVGALVNAKAKGRKLRPRRTTKEGDVILDAVRVSEVPLTFTVRDARWGKQHFVAPIHEHQQTFKLDTPRRGTLMGSVRASDGTAPRGVVLSLIGRDGTITELEGDDVRFEHDGTFTTPVVPDGYQVRASAPGFCPSDWARTQVSLSVPGTVELVVLRASKISGPLVVTDGTNTERAIEVELESQGRSGPVATTHRVRTDALGFFELKEIRPGWYRIRACDAKREGTWATVQVMEGLPVENCTIVLDGDRHEPALEAIIRDPGGTPLPEVTVWGRTRRALTDDYGKVVLRLDPRERDSQVTFEKEGYEPERREVSVPRPEEPPLGLEVTLEPLD